MEKIIQHSWKEELNKWSLTFKQKLIEQNYQMEEKKKRSRIHIGFAYILICWSVLLIFYQAAIKREYSYQKFYIYYINHFIFSIFYIITNHFKPQFYNLTHFFYLYAYTLNVTWGIYDKDFNEFDERKSISYGYINAFLLCSCIEGGNFLMKSFLFTTTGFIFIASESLSERVFQSTNFVRLVFPSVLYILKIRHEEIIKRQIFIQTNQIMEWASMIHKQLPTPFMVGKFNKKEERLEFYSSNLKAEKQLKIFDNDSFNSFLENCYINDSIFMLNRKGRNSQYSGIISSLDKNSSEGNLYSQYQKNLRSESNSLKWMIRENLHDQLQEQQKANSNPSASPAIFYPTSANNNQKSPSNIQNSQFRESAVSVQNKRPQSQMMIKSGNSTAKKNAKNINSQNQDNSIKKNIFIRQNSKTLEKQMISQNNIFISGQQVTLLPIVEQYKNETLDQERSPQFMQQNVGNFKDIIAENDFHDGKNMSDLNVPMNKSLPVGANLFIKSPNFKDEFNYDQSEELGDYNIQETTQQIHMKQIHELKLNTQIIQLNSANANQDNVLSSHSQVPGSKKFFDTETPLDTKTAKGVPNQYSTMKRSKSKKATKEFTLEGMNETQYQQNQGLLEQKSIQQHRGLLKKPTQEKINSQPRQLEKEEKGKNLFNFKVENEQEEAISVVHYYIKDGNETERKFALRQKYFQSNELYVVLILENESFKSKYEKEKKKNNLLNAITSEQEDYVKDSIQRIDGFIKQQSTPEALNIDLKNQSKQQQSFQFVLSTCANLFIMHETYKIFNSFLKKHTIQIVAMKFNIFSTISMIANSLNLIYSNQRKQINVQLEGHDKGITELFVLSDLVKIKVLFYNLFNYLLCSSNENTTILIKLQCILDSQIQPIQLKNIHILIQFSKNMNESFLKNQNIFSLNYYNLFNDTQSASCSYKPLWQLRTACRIITLLGPYSKLDFTQKDNNFIFSFLLYQDINIIQVKKLRKSKNPNSKRVFTFMESPPHIQVNNLQKLLGYNNEDKVKFVKHVIDLNQIQIENTEESIQDSANHQHNNEQIIKISANNLQSEMSLKYLTNYDNQK